MNDTEHIDELIEEMKEYNNMLDNNKKLDKEKTKENIIEYEEKIEVDDLDKTKVIEGNVSEEKIKKREEKKPKKDDEEDKKFNKTIIIVVCSIVGVFILVVLLLIIISNNRSKTISGNDKDILSKSDYISIVKEYGDATSDTVKEFMEAYNGKVPTFNEIKKNISSKYKVTCSSSIINYDGSVYLDDCLVEGYTNKFKYSYGTLLEEEKKVSSNKKIYIYKNNNNDSSNYYALNNTVDIENIKLIDTYHCSSDECKGYNTSTKNNKDVVIFDNDYYLYNPVSHDKNKLSGLSNYKYMFIDLLTRGDGTSFALYITRDDGAGAFYRVDRDTIITDFIYSGNTTTEKLLEMGYFAGQKQTKNNSSVSIIHQSTGEEVNIFTGAIYISDYTINNKSFYYLGASLFGEKTGCILTTSFTRLINDKEYYTYSINSDGTISINNDTSFITYDINGTKIYESSLYTKVLKVLNDYVIVSTDKQVNILDNNGKFITKFFDTKSTYEYHTSLTNTDHKNNIINLVVLDTSINDGVEGRGLEYTYKIDTKEINVLKLTTIGGHD